MGNSILLSDDDAHRIREKVIKERNTKYVTSTKEKGVSQQRRSFFFSG
jgi:hypothetical protein